MRAFALIGALLFAGGVFLLVAAGIRLSDCLRRDTFSYEIWSTHFWLLRPGNVGAGLSHNAHWFLRIAGGLLAMALGSKVLKIATR